MDRNKTKVGRIRFLTYFGSALSDMQLESGNIEKNPLKSILWILVKLASLVRPKNVPLRMRPFPLHIEPYGDVLRTSGRFSGTSSGRNFAK